MSWINVNFHKSLTVRRLFEGVFYLPLLMDLDLNSSTLSKLTKRLVFVYKQSTRAVTLLLNLIINQFNQLF